MTFPKPLTPPPIPKPEIPTPTLDIPMVPFGFPGDEEDSWIDLYDQLIDQRVILLCEELEEEISNEIISIMLYLNMEDNTQDIFFFINSYGGDVINGMAIHNIMEYIPPDINTICVGIAASTAAYILAGGDFNKRIAFPHARIMIHQPYNPFPNPKDDTKLFLAEAEEYLAIKETVARVYSEITGKPFWIISQDMERKVYMSATEAQAYGIIDHIKGNYEKQNI